MRRLTVLSAFPLLGIIVAACVGSIVANTALPDRCSDHYFSSAAHLSDGPAIYRQLCAACHGDRGQGTRDYPEPLRGSWSLEELTEYIAHSMPEDDPDLCVGEEAGQVARFMHETFYFVGGDRELELPAIAFSRLTVRQFRESVADLLGNFSDFPAPSAARGLKAHYYAARNRTEDRKLAEQLDAAIDYQNGVPHFDPSGQYAHLPPKEKPDENRMNEGFSVYWSGSLLAPDTGSYRIIVESKNGFQLRLNGSDPPLIDRKVRSDDVEEHAAQIYLLAGRAYPIRIDFFSYPDPPARIRLMWEPPHGVVEVIPSMYLVPEVFPESMAVSITFPADDASFGFERGISVSREWDEATTSAALETADWVADRLSRLVGARQDADDREQRMRRFCQQIVEMAFGRPLDENERQFFVDQHFDNDWTEADQVKRVVILTLKSPRFLYPELESRDTSFRNARRLALVLWDSLPDRQLYALARSGELAQSGIVREQIARMVEDPRSRAKLKTFFAHWLKFETAAETVKDPDRFPGFDRRLVVDLRRSLELQLEQIAWSGRSDLRELFLSDTQFVNRRIAEFYEFGLDNIQAFENEHDFVSVSLDVSERAGVIMHPYVMSGLAYYRESSPIHRGVFVARQMLGRPLRPPMENFEPLSEDFDPSMTNRQRVEYQTQDAACLSCHRMINPLGFSLENFDSVGRYRTTEKGQLIDASAVYEPPNAGAVVLNGGKDLAAFIAADADAHRHFVRQLFRHYVRQPVEAYGAEALESLYQRFEASDYSIRQLLTDIAEWVVTFDG